MKALILPTGRPLAPFGDPPGQARILDRPLEQVQRAVVEAAGLELVDSPPAREPYLVLSDRTWLTRELLRRFLAAADGQPARLKVEDPEWLEGTSPLQQLAGPGLYEVALMPPGQPAWERCPALVLDLELETPDLPELHPRMQHVKRPLRVGPAMVHQLDHWSHLVRVNQLALAARAFEERREFEQSNLLRKLWIGLKVVWRARSLDGYRIARALTQAGPKCDIHPTAVVELCVLGEGVKIGPHAVVRASVLGDGAVVDEHASVNLSVVGQGAHVGRFAMVNLAVLYPDAWLSWCNGTQACVIGREAFVAWGCTLLDMSFGRTIKVEVEQPDGSVDRVDSQQHFLGVAVGHRAVIGHAVKVNYGVAMPNDAVLVAGAEGLLRGWGDGPTGEPCRVEEGRAVAVKKGG